MKRRPIEIIAIVGSGIVVAAVINSCTSLHDHPIFQSAPGATSQTELPKLYTEAYIEFAGPASRWAGPPTWILHVKASNPPELTLTPPLQASSEPLEKPAAMPAPQLERDPAAERVPAGVAAITPIGNSAPIASGPPVPMGPMSGGPLTADLVRARLAQLEQWTTPQPLATGSSEFRSCLSPVRVKLIRSDGVITERRGCRVQSSWSTQVSSIASEFLGYLAN